MNSPERICTRPEPARPSVTRPLAAPIQPTSVWQCESPAQVERLLGGELEGYAYQRDGHPNADSLAARIRELHGAEQAAVTSSGMAALSSILLSRVRQGDHLLMHGSVVSRLIREVADGIPVCVTITHLDGLVYARSAFNSSMHYRSVMVFGKAQVVDEPEAKAAALDTLVEHLFPGRLADVRPNHRKEVNATEVLSLSLETASLEPGPFAGLVAS